jgi:ABC-type branched-subunit amino acid transport system ATPase component/ABC-type branched-subunit amino acid transport system permease subunit
MSGMSGQAVLIGATTGMGYGLLAAGLVLVYRATRVVNFAHAEFGMFGATLMGLVVGNYHWNYWAGLAVGVLAGALWGCVAELVVVKRLSRRSVVVLFIATVGLAQVVFLTTISLPNANVAAGYPQAFTGPIHVFGLSIPTEFHLGSVFFQSRVVSLVLLAVPALGALAWFLNRTKYGLMIRASAGSQETAKLVGVRVRMVSTMVWTIAGGFAALTTILMLPFSGAGIANAAQPAGPGLLVRALVVALLASLRSLPKVVVAGVLVGVSEAYLIRNFAHRPGITEVALLVVLLLLVLRVRSSPDDEAPLITRRAVIPDDARRLRSVRAVPRVATAGLFAFLALIPVVATKPSQLNSWMFVLLVAAVATSATVLTGWAGQLSLGQYAFFGLGAATMTLVSGQGTVPLPFVISHVQPDLPFLPAFMVSALVGGVVAVVIGLPALRTRGLFLAVVTLAFAVAMEGFVLRQDFWTNGAPIVSRQERPVFGPIDFANARTMYYGILAFLAVVVIATLRLRRTGSGRTMLAVRDNPSVLASSGVSVSMSKLVAFAFAGVVAAASGALLTLVPPTLTFTRDFPAMDSVRIVAVAIIGGLGSIPGAVLGALWVFGLPIMFDGSQTVELAASGIGLLLLLLYVPGGLMQIGDAIHLAIVGWLVRRRPQPVAETRTVRSFPRRSERHPPSAVPGLLLQDVSVAFGGRVAVDHVDLRVDMGELVGLIGTNGAGKTTLMNAVSGFVPAKGLIELQGERIDDLPSFKRHRAGLARSFQSATLYPGLTVRESVMVALEARERSHFVPSMLAVPPSPGAERRKRSESSEIIDFLGLTRFGDRLCADLSTGTRRIVELGLLLASEASVLLLDEPTGGVAQREAEAFGPLILRVRDELGAAVLLIEHDMPLVMSISDRVYCLEVGNVISCGTPAEVRNDPLVIASYLGVDDRAIARSGSASA